VQHLKVIKNKRNYNSFACN